MNQVNTFKLILGNKMYLIPSDFPFVTDLNLDIYSTLQTNQQYEVESNVSQEVFRSFIDYWINGDIPNIHIDNISEYYLLSQEFNIMNNLIQIFRKYTSNMIKFSTDKDLKIKNQLLVKKNKEKCDKLDDKTQKFQQIIQILFNNDRIYSHSKFFTVKKELIKKCEKEEIKYLDLLTRKEFNENGLTFVLDDEQKKAIVYRCTSTESDIIIPGSVMHDSQKFFVTGIIEGAFLFSTTVKSIQFSEDSELHFIDKMAFSHSSLERIVIPASVTRIDQFAFAFCKHLKNVTFSEHSKLNTIERCAFSMSSIESLTIPSGITNFKEGWCASIMDLITFNIQASENDLVSFCNGLFLLTKSDSKSDTFDVLIFARRDIEVAVIPDFVKRIESYAFNNCSKLQKVLFLPNSQLASIGSFAFANSTLESIHIPPAVSSIGESIFSACSTLNDVQIPENTQLKSFSSHAFNRSSIEHIRVPSNFTHIGENAFINCSKLKVVHIPEDTKLKIIDNSTFSSTSIQNIKIPYHVAQIAEKAFWGCQNLQSIQFSEGSEFRIIDKYAFSNTSLASLTIPSSVAILKEGWCYDTPQLVDIKIVKTNKKGQYISPYNNEFIIGKSYEKSDTYDVLIIAPRNIEVASVPSFIKRIGPHSFNKCVKLQKVQFEQDSQLVTIEKAAFYHSSLKNILIPSQVTKIGELAFSCCKKLTRIVFQDDSELALIKKNAFTFSSLENFVVPSKVIEIGDDAFANCSKLQIIEVSAGSKLKKHSKRVFKETSPIILVPPRLWD